MARRPKAAKKAAATTTASEKLKVMSDHPATPVVETVEPAPAPTAAQLLSQSQQTTDTWYKAVRIKKGYANYVKSGKKLLQEWNAKQRTDEVNEGASEEEATERTELGEAFNVVSDKTPTALRLLVAYKCNHQGCGFSTAEGIRSAFKDYFEWYED
ncbi:hypothetical protein H0H81_007285, partial [Sphagnurus paluster]